MVILAEESSTMLLLGTTSRMADSVTIRVLHSGTKALGVA